MRFSGKMWLSETGEIDKKKEVLSIQRLFAKQIFFFF